MGRTDEPSGRLASADLAIACVLAILPLAIYLQTRSFGPVDLDDDFVVGIASRIWQGLSADNALWSLRATPGALWQPMVLLSLMLDVELYGKNHGGFHLTNTFLHVANVLLFFLLLRLATGDRWKAAFAAALWGVHPLRVESVAWITERKDVLSTCWALLALLAWVRYTRVSKLRWLSASWVAFLCSLMAKQMYVTLPCVMLLMDFWPLGRARGAIPRPAAGSPSAFVRQRSWGSLVFEKLPFFGLTAVFCVVTWRSQQSGRALPSVEQLSIPLRLGNALVAYAWYLEKTFWPTGLAAYYPHPGSSLSAAAVIGSALLLLAISAAVIRQLRGRPYLAMGWFWFLGTLVPVIGLVQAGNQARADRFTYLPQMGLIIAFVWLLPSLVLPRWANRRLLPALGGLAVVVLSMASVAQARYWQDSISLFGRALEVTENNHVAHNNLGKALCAAGRYDKGWHHFQQAIRISEGENADARLNIGELLQRQGRLDEAIREYTIVAESKPHEPQAFCMLGAALLEQGRLEQSRLLLEEALRLDPEHAESRLAISNTLAAMGRFAESLPHLDYSIKLFPEDAPLRIKLGNALHSLGRLDDAIAQFRKAIELEPWNAGGHNNLGLALRDAGRLDEAIGAFRLAVERDRRNAMACNNLGTTLSMQGKLIESRQAFEKALQIDPKYAIVHANLGLLAMRLEDWDQAVSHFEEAARLKPDFAEVQELIRQAKSRKP